MAGEPRDIIAAAIHDCRYGDSGDAQTLAETDLETDAVLAALTDAGIVLCRRERTGAYLTPWRYVPVKPTP